MEATKLSLESRNIQSVMYLSLEMLCKEYRFDRGCVFLYNSEEKVFFKAFECTLDDLVTNYLAVKGMKLDEYLHQSIIENLKTPENLKSLFKQDSYLYTQNFYSVNDLLKSVQFEKKTEDIYEFFTFPLNGYVGYITFEKHSAKPFLSIEDIIKVTEMCKFLSCDIEKITFENNASEWRKLLQIQRVILENEKYHIHVIKKDTYEILYFNKLFKQLNPDVEIGQKCYSLKGYNEKCINCVVDSGFVAVDNYFGDKTKNWLVHSEIIHWLDNEEAYLIYTKQTENIKDNIADLDELTGLISATHFKLEYERILNSAKVKYALFIFDIDKFKYINDTWGYDIGNDVLNRTTNLISSMTQKDELFCRLGDDKFALLLQCPTEISIDKRIETLNFTFENMQKLFFKNIKVTFICGIAYIDNEKEYNTICDKANTARKSVKGSHKNTFKLYDEALEVVVEQEKMIEERMLTALENGEFIPYLQPKINLNTKRIYGAEALVRWQAYDRMIYPDEFITVFEKNGFITVLDFVIYEKVIQYIRRCLDNGVNIYPISLNASRGHIKDKKFINKLLTLLEKYKVPLELIEIEVTEGILVEDKLVLNQFIKQLRDNGVKVSVDDFGTAYSSLNLLKDVDIDVIKIDKGFLHNIDLSEGNNVSDKDKVVIRHIVQMAKELDFEVVCEGVETLEQVEFLKSIGCENGQGYVFARPMTIEEFEAKFLII